MLGSLTKIAGWPFSDGFPIFLILTIIFLLILLLFYVTAEENRARLESIKLRREIEAKENEDIRCEKCFYWDNNKTGSVGLCKRYPPMSNSLSTNKNDYCGEYVYDWERNIDDK